jgi:hypothetical protein
VRNKAESRKEVWGSGGISPPFLISAYHFTPGGKDEWISELVWMQWRKVFALSTIEP